MNEDAFTFLALGDSYTLGEAVSEKERWSVQLVVRLREDGVAIENPQIIATTGWTTDELISNIGKADVKKSYSIVSLLIGVNNQYRGYPVAQYEAEFEILLNQATKFAGGNPKNVFVISIPNYGITPFAHEKKLDVKKIGKELDEYNALAGKITLRKKANFTNISRGLGLVEKDEALVAMDGLHPSGKMYAQWVESVYSKVYDNLSSR